MGDIDILKQALIKELVTLRNLSKQELEIMERLNAIAARMVAIQRASKQATFEA